MFQQTQDLNVPVHKFYVIVVITSTIDYICDYICHLLRFVYSTVHCICIKHYSPLTDVLVNKTSEVASPYFRSKIFQLSVYIYMTVIVALCLCSKQYI